jgi:hypothetical protein
MTKPNFQTLSQPVPAGLSHGPMARFLFANAKIAPCVGGTTYIACGKVM